MESSFVYEYLFMSGRNRFKWLENVALQKSKLYVLLYVV